MLRLTGISQDETTIAQCADLTIKRIADLWILALEYVVLNRSPHEPPFTSSDSKLLDGVGTLMAGAIRSTQLYDELLQHTEVLRQREARLKAVLDSVADAIITVDDRDIIDSFNPSAEQLFGYNAPEIVGKPIESLLQGIFEPDRSASGLQTADLKPTLSPRRELQGRRKDGSPLWMDLAMSDMPVGESRARVVSLRDVSARKQSEEMLQHQALYDALTDLPNRLLLRTQMDRLLVDGRQTGQQFATLLLDLDRFQDVNDIIGHKFGDLVLREVGNRLREVLRQTDLVARFGGDEFAVLLPAATNVSATHVAEKICKTLEEPFVIDGYQLNIGLAEQSGLIGPLTRWVLRTALRQCQVWLEQGHRICVAVNLSAQNLHAPWLPALIQELLESSRVPPDLLQVEITESSLMVDPSRALATLATLSRAGVRISIDDFGTGYSSLAYLKRLPVNEIKIDRSFVSQMAGESNDEVLVRSIIGLGHDLGLTVVAEGVEESATLQRLASLHCDTVQGFYLSRPKPALALGEWLATFPTLRRFEE